MASELAFVLINPYTIRKSRTGGIIARYISRTGLDLVGARMFGPSKALAEEYAKAIRHSDSDHPETCGLIADYILNNYAPDPLTGKVHRAMLLLFEGEDAVKKVWDVTGSATLRWGSGETIRDTFGDYVVDNAGNVTYFEPAVLAAPTRERAAATLGLWAKYTDTDGGIIASPLDLPDKEHIERTLVLIKPDNFKFPSARPGSIIDTLSTSGLRIVAIKKFCMTVAQAEQFYGPVQDTLRGVFANCGPDRARKALAKEFGFDIEAQHVTGLCEELAPLFAQTQFENIVRFMTGHRPSDLKDSEKRTTGSQGCLALVYDGVDAVKKIRDVLGPTDPDKAKPGSVRKEFGSNVMVNAAHASDSPENAEREIAIIGMEEDALRPWADRYYGKLFTRLAALRMHLPGRSRIVTKARHEGPELDPQ